MADVPYRLDNGLNTSGDPLRLPPGYLERCEGAIYMPDDPDRLHKHPGRSSVGTLPAAATTANTKGFVHLQYDEADDKFILYANSQLYEITAATSGILAGNWTSVQDQGTPTAYARSGSFLKAIPDGDNGWIMWTGADEERPIIREEGGHAWFLGLAKPVAPTLSAITSTPTVVRPTGRAAAAGSVTAGGSSLTVTQDWDQPTNAYDDDQDTRMFAAFNWTVNGVAAEVFSFTEGGNIPANQELHLFYGGSIKGVMPTQVYFQISYTGDVDGNYSTVHTFALNPRNADHSSAPDDNPYKEHTIIPLSSGTAWTSFKIRVIAHDKTWGTATPVVFEMFTQESTAGNSSTIDAGTYYYAYTEVFEIAGERPRYIESAPSDFVSIVAAGTENGVLLTFSTDVPEANLATDGVTDDPDNGLKHYRKIYRTTKTGTWPDLGYVGNATIGATTWADTFETAGDTLGSPGINVVYEKDIPIEAAGVPPAFRDAVYFRGVIIVVPETDPFKLVWSMPGQPHYFPNPSHELALIPSYKNDELTGVTAVGDSVIVFSRSRVLRIREIKFVDRANYDPQSIEIDTLSPSEGLAGSPLSYTLAHSQKGHEIVAWVSDNGIWMSDGTLVSEGGMGAVKLSVYMNWRKEVDTTALADTRLSYDSVLQMICFEYTDKDGNSQVKYLHTSPHHWVQTGQDQAVPKTSGPHTDFAVKQRTFGQISGEIKHWSLDTSGPNIYNERDGTDRAGSNVLTHIRSGKQYLGGARGEFHAYEGSLMHSDWGPSEACDLEIRTYRDMKGIPQVVHKKGLKLNGERTTDFWVDRAGRSMQVILQHDGNTISDGTKTRAFGPLIFDAESLGEVE